MKVALLWLINEKGEILISKRAAHMSTDANMWGPSVSGKIEPGETAKQAAVREATEELGIDPKAIVPLRHLHDSTHHHSDGNLREFYIFSAKVPSTVISTMKLEPREVATVRWISVRDLQSEFMHSPETIIISSDQRLWQEIFTNLKKVAG